MTILPGYFCWFLPFLSCFSCLLPTKCATAPCTPPQDHVRAAPRTTADGGAEVSAADLAAVAADGTVAVAVAAVDSAAAAAADLVAEVLAVAALAATGDQ
jgi:hypothetical protein